MSNKTRVSPLGRILTFAAPRSLVYRMIAEARARLVNQSFLLWDFPFAAEKTEG